MAQKMGGTFPKGRNRSVMVEENVIVTVDTPLQLSGLSLRYVE